MKIAKKVLALAIAVVMIASLSAMAFAASLAKEDAKFELVLDETDDGTFVKVYAKNCENLASANLVFTFDKDVVEKVRFMSGADAKQVNGDNFENNSFTDEKNTDNLEAVEYGFYFKSILWSTEKFAAEDLSEEANINGENFHITTIKLTLKDGKTAADVVVSAKASATFSNGLSDDAKVEETNNEFPVIGIEKKEEETTKKEEETTAKKEEETTAKKEEATTKAPVTPESTTAKGNEGANKPTGDTGLLAIAAGVVAVAGAAFVVTKKRK